MSTTRIVANNSIFQADPEGYIRSLFGNEIKNVRYVEQDVILPNNRIVVDVSFDKAYIPSLKTLYINVSDLKSFNSQTGSYMFDYEGKPVCLSAFSSQLKGKTRIPVKIYPYDKNDKYYSYVAVPLKEPLHAYSTIISTKYNLSDVHADVPISNHSGKELYNEEQTIDALKKEISKYEIFEAINDFKIVKSFEETKNSTSSTAFVMDYKLLPNEQINGHIVVISHRKSDLLFYYPNSANVIYADEIQFIKDFMSFDRSNLP